MKNQACGILPVAVTIQIGVNTNGRRERPGVAIGMFEAVSMDAMETRQRNRRVTAALQGSPGACQAEWEPALPSDTHKSA
jgi:transposase-like protein